MANPFRPAAWCVILLGLFCQVARADLPAWDVKQHSTMINTMIVDGPRVWLGTDNKGLWVADRAGRDWKRVVPDGTVDDPCIRSLARDRQGRIWVGHGRMGVSVYDGEKWSNYDAPRGPMGHRVFRIAINPVDGDVWMATELGLTRYSVAQDRWSHITRVEGLIANELDSLAFDSHGILYVGTQCAGIAIARPTDQYATWQNIAAQTERSDDPTGEGLPSNLINEVFVARDDTVYVGTDDGLAWSRDQGKTWNYLRGQDYVMKVQNRPGGAPAGWTEPKPHLALSGDEVLALAEDGDGLLWVGTRRHGVDLLDIKTLTNKEHVAPKTAAGVVDFVTCFALSNDPAEMLVGTYGRGIGRCESKALPAPQPTTSPVIQAKLPTPFSVNAKQFDVIRGKLAALQKKPLVAEYLGDDWVTRGDGAGRYGKHAAWFPFYDHTGWAQGYSCDFRTGETEDGKPGSPYTYFGETRSKDVRATYIVNAGCRVFGEINDGAFPAQKYPYGVVGPDLWIHVKLPAGTHRMTMLFVSHDGGSGANRFRDMVVEVHPSAGTFDEVKASAPLARTRVFSIYQPVYKQFLLAGEQEYWVKIDRNNSFVCKVAGIYFDRIQGDSAVDIDNLPSPLLDPAHWGPPTAERGEGSAMRETGAMWDELDTRFDDASATPFQIYYRLLAFRAAEGSQVDASVLANWRWHLHLWTEEDREEFCQQMDAGNALLRRDNPAPKDEPARVPMVDWHSDYKAARDQEIEDAK